MVAIVTFDAIASVASKSIGFPYPRATFGSYLIYVAVGFFAARSVVGSPVGAGALIAAIVGICEASVGWAVSWAIGPGRPPDGVQLTVGRWIGVVLFVAVVAAGLGALGAGIGAVSSRLNAPAA